MVDKHPVQPLVWDGPVIRFKQNAIVTFIVDWCAGRIGGPAPDLNIIATMDFTKDDLTQFAQLIGYSVSGAGDLSYFDRRVLAQANRKAAAMGKNNDIPRR